MINSMLYFPFSKGSDRIYNETPELLSQCEAYMGHAPEGMPTKRMNLAENLSHQLSRWQA